MLATTNPTAVDWPGSGLSGRRQHLEAFYGCLYFAALHRRRR
jgi:hypothetical protein